ncbi:hypothetical protein IFM89_031040 [Coptis chinensis]|uniref:Cytochrome P450 71A1 n=1 Tax=Coptis chinensis TaxID=261450 RepID=A0A835HA78_9MAGN|nr:hypothetical protein IFM89_031040 [Coptis chinensis]
MWYHPFTVEMAFPAYLFKWLAEQQLKYSYHLFPFSLLISFFVFILLRLINGAWSQKPNLPPSPPKYPIIGNLHQLGTLVHRSLRDLSDKYGPIMLLHLGGAPTLVVSSKEWAKEILKTHDITFANRPHTTAAKLLFYGCIDGAFAPYGEYWRQVRKIFVIELLSIKRVQSFSFIREEEITNMIEKISHLCSEGATINLSEMLLGLSNDIVSRCVLGRKREKKDGENKFGDLSRELVHLLGAFSFGDFFPWLGWMDSLTGLIERIKKVSRDLDTFLDEIIDEHVKQMKQDGSDDKNDFVDILLHVQKNNILDTKFTRENIKALVLDMIVGGTDTTSTTIEWAITELVKNPNIMKNVQEEIRRVTSKKQKLDEEDIQQMDYLKSVVKETLRLHPPLPLLVPHESSAATNLKGYHVPSKTRVYINAWAIQRDPEMWNNPEEFSPERFSSDNIVDLKGQDYEYFPFGSGRRGCPGMLFGLAVSEFVIANLLYWFDWELPGGTNKEDLDMTEYFGLVVTKKIPLHLVPTSHCF